MTLNKLTEKEMVKIWNKIITSFSPIDDRNCPNIRKELVLEGKLDQYQKVAEVDLNKLPVGHEVYFFGLQNPAYYTLKIVENGMVHAWRDTDTNALIGPIHNIITRQVNLINGIEEGILRVGELFIMPYFNYNSDCKHTELKEVLKPNDVYFGTCMGLFLTKK